MEKKHPSILLWVLTFNSFSNKGQPATSPLLLECYKQRYLSILAERKQGNKYWHVRNALCFSKKKKEEDMLADTADFYTAKYSNGFKNSTLIRL